MIIDAVFQEVDEMSGASFGDVIVVNEGGTSPSGENGATFTPYVSADGIISWTNDKGLKNPTPVNIKGADGDDYVLTDADKQEIAEMVGGGQSVTEWELLGSKTLTAETTQENTKVQDYKTNLKGLRVKVIVPPDTGFSSNLISCQFALNNSRSFIVRANNITRITNANAYVYFEALPKLDVWNCEVYPYDKSMGTIGGDLVVTDADEIRYANVSATTLPVGTVIEFWGVK